MLPGNCSEILPKSSLINRSLIFDMTTIDVVWGSTMIIKLSGELYA